MDRGVIAGVFLPMILLTWIGGCRSRGQEDLYRQTLQREVRVLEDQLYEADYENRVLIDKLRRERAHESGRDSGRRPSQRHAAQSPAGDSDAMESVPPTGTNLGLGQGFDDAPIDDAFRSRGDSNSPLNDPTPLTESIPAGDASKDSQARQRNTPKKDSGSKLPIPKPRPDPNADDLLDIDALIDPGTLVEPGTRIEPAQSSGPDEVVDPSDLVDPRSLMDPSQFQGIPESIAPGPRRMMIPELLPPPGGPTPPGTNDLQINPIEPGIPAPPNAPNGRPDGPPGKIDFPFSTTMLGGLGQVAGAAPKIELTPKKIRIDATLSQVRLSTNDAGSDSPVTASEGVDLVVRADDPYGHPIAILGRSHDPTAKLQSETAIKTRPLPKQATYLSVIALDPTKTGDESKLGRWDFNTSQLQELETLSRANQGNGFATTLPIRWKDRRPEGESVVFFARLRSQEIDIRCEAQVELTKAPSVAGWLPRR